MEAKTPIVQSSLRLQLGSFLVVNPMDTLSECGMGYACYFARLSWRGNKMKSWIKNETHQVKNIGGHFPSLCNSIKNK